MAYCGKKQKRHSLHSNLSNVPTHLQQRIKQFYNLQMSLEQIGLLFEKFETFSTLKYGLEVQQETQFKYMIGNLGNFYIGSRIFNVVLQLSLQNEERQTAEFNRTKDPRTIALWNAQDERRISESRHPNKQRNFIVVEDYIIYMDLIYHGSDDEKDLIAFMMIDEVGQGKITFPFYENFMVQYYNMIGELRQQHTIDSELCHDFSLEWFQMIASANLPEPTPEEQASLSQERKISHGKKSSLSKSKAEDETLTR